MKKCINATMRRRDNSTAVIPAERSESRNPLAAPSSSPARSSSWTVHATGPASHASCRPCDLRSRPRCSMGSGSALGFASLARNDERPE